MPLLNISCHVRCKQKKKFRFYSDKKSTYLSSTSLWLFIVLALKEKRGYWIPEAAELLFPITQTPPPLAAQHILYKLYTFFFVIPPPLPELSTISSSGQEFRQQRSRSDLEDEVGNTAVHVEYNALLWKLRSRRSIWNFSYQYEGSYELAFA